MGLVTTAAKAAVASSVHGRVQRRQQRRWAEQDQSSGASNSSREAGVLTDAEFAAEKARILQH
jgi:hypothetical protein